MRQEKKETAGGAEFSGGVALSGVIISRTTLLALREQQLGQSRVVITSATSACAQRPTLFRFVENAYQRLLSTNS